MYIYRLFFEEELLLMEHLRHGFNGNHSGAHPTIVSYNARAVKIYSRTSSPGRLKSIFFYFKTLRPTRYSGSVVNAAVVGLAPG
jgi:hypothetical protein